MQKQGEENSDAENDTHKDESEKPDEEGKPDGEPETAEENAEMPEEKETAPDEEMPRNPDKLDEDDNTGTDVNGVGRKDEVRKKVPRKTVKFWQWICWHLL